MKSESEIERACELLKADCRRLRDRGGSRETEQNQAAMVFALSWVLDEQKAMELLLKYIEQVSREAAPLARTT